jgi:sugar phosphate isomerase/epimerase
MKTAVSNIAWSPADREEAYTLLSRNGIIGLEIAPGLFLHEADDTFLPSPEDCKRATAEIETHGLHLVSMQSLLFGTEGAELFGDDRARSLFVNGMTRAINLAEILEIPNLVFGSPKQRIIPAYMSADEAAKIAVDVFRDLGDRALRAGTRISLEPNPKIYDTNFLNTVDEVIEMTKVIDHPAVRFTLDIGALHANAEISKMQSILGSDGIWIGHAHLSAPWLHAPTETSSEIEEYMRCLTACGYQGFISLEMKQPENGIAGLSRPISQIALAGGR